MDRGELQRLGALYMHGAVELPDPYAGETTTPAQAAG